MPLSDSRLTEHSQNIFYFVGQDTEGVFSRNLSGRSGVNACMLADAVREG